MQWLKRLFEPAWWFRWTVAGRAVRDGWAGLPVAAQVREMPVPKGRVDQLAALLWARQGEPAKSAQVDGDGVPRKDGDYDVVLAALSAAMKARGGSLEGVDHAERVRLVGLMADLLSEANPRTPTTEPTSVNTKVMAIGTVMTHYEANVVDLANHDAAKVREGWEKSHHKLEAEQGRISNHLGHVMRQLARQHHLHQDKGYRSPHPMIPMWLYVTMMCFIGVLEMPFNLEAFRILDVGPEERWLLALGPSIAILFLAHLSGTKLRQWPDRFSWTHVLVVGTAALAVLLALGAVGMLRADYLAAVNKEPLNVRQALELIAINLIFLVAGTFAAYAAHDPDRELERICREKKQLRKEVNQLWKHLNKVAGDYDTQRGVALAEIERIRTYAVACIGEYRDMNSRARAGAQLPESFRQPVDDRFFAPVDLGPELDRAPQALQDLLRTIDGEEALSAIVQPPMTAPKDGNQLVPVGGSSRDMTEKPRA
jgi:hypothetical protein